MREVDSFSCQRAFSTVHLVAIPALLDVQHQTRSYYTLISLRVQDRQQARSLGSPQRRGRGMTPVMACKAWAESGNPMSGSPSRQTPYLLIKEQLVTAPAQDHLASAYTEYYTAMMQIDVAVPKYTKYTRPVETGRL